MVYVKVHYCLCENGEFTFPHPHKEMNNLGIVTATIKKNPIPSISYIWAELQNIDNLW